MRKFLTWFFGNNHRIEFVQQRNGCILAATIAIGLCLLCSCGPQVMMALR